VRSPGHWTTAELAELRLAALPRHARNIGRLARREGWPSSPHPRWPWARVYRQDDLPAAVQAELRARGLWAEPARHAPEPTPPAPAITRRGRPCVLTGQARDAALAILADRPDVAAVRLAELLELAGHAVSPRAAQRWLAAWRREHRSLHQALRAPDRWRGRFQPAFGRRDDDLERPNARWEVDATASDVLLEGGRRCTVYGIIDVWSRRALVLPAWTGTAAALSGVLAVAIRLWGLPEQIRADNGADFRSGAFLGACSRLGIEVVHTGRKGRPLSEIGEAAATAFRLLLAADPELLAIVALSLEVSLTATALAALLGLPLGALLALARFPGRGLLVLLVDTGMGLPPVVVGLLVYLLLSRAGPLGGFGLLFTPTAMVIAQTVLVTPIVAALARSAVADLLEDYREHLASLGIRTLAAVPILLWDARYRLATACLAGFGRAAAEVGAILIVGGNIRGHTRTMTTAIALETSKGALAQALALGIVLLLVVLAVNFAVAGLARAARRIEG